MAINFLDNLKRDKKIIHFVPITGISGSGKNFLIDALINHFPSTFMAPVQYSTRAMRLGETEGNPYRFISDKEYEERKDEFTVRTGYYGAKYGTLKSDAFNADDTRIRLINADFDGWLSLFSDLHKLQSENFQANILPVLLLSYNKETRTGREELDRFQERTLKSFADIIITPWDRSKLFQSNLGEKILPILDQSNRLNIDPEIEAEREKTKRLVFTPSKRNDDLDHVAQIISERLQIKASITA